MGYFNDYILIHRSCKYFSKIGLRELITDKHRTEVPGSTRLNKQNAIDVLWGSSGIFTTSYRYIPVNYGIKLYHRLIWVKTSLLNALGDKTLPSKTPLARKLRLCHRPGQQKYISKIRHITRQHNLFPRRREL